MFTTRWQPWVELQSEMNRLRDEMDRAFGRYTGRRFPLAPTAYPLVNVWEDDERLYVEAELPGLEMSDLEIYVQGDQLTIKGQRPERRSENATCHRQERSFSQFARTLDLPVRVNPDKVEAEFKNGVLTVKLPKGDEARARRIEVKG
jgi:HSP20 family protein